jgi:hypothetical protein
MCMILQYSERTSKYVHIFNSATALEGQEAEP